MSFSHVLPSRALTFTFIRHKEEDDDDEAEEEDGLEKIREKLFPALYSCFGMRMPPLCVFPLYVCIHSEVWCMPNYL